MKYEFIKSPRKILYTALVGAVILNGCGKNISYDEAMEKQYEIDKQSVMETQQEFIELDEIHKEALRSSKGAVTGIEKLIEKTKEMPVLDVNIQENKINVRR